MSEVVTQNELDELFKNFPVDVEDEKKVRDHKDNVHHPDHYNKGPIECWDVMEQVYGIQETMVFCKLNAFKYLWRCDCKNGTEDIKKAKTYLEKYLELEYKLCSKGE